MQLLGLSRPLLILGILAFGVIGFFFTAWIERLFRKWKLGRRESLTVAEIYKNFYSGTKIELQEFSKLWFEIASILHVDAEKLRPTDRIEELAGIARQISIFSDIDDLEALANERKVGGLDKIATLDDFVKAIFFCETGFHSPVGTPAA